MRNRDSALKVGTDAVLLGAAMTILPEDRTALDIGTGTGVIALMAAQRAPAMDIKAVEADGPSAAEADSNFRMSPWSGRLESINIPLQRYTPEDSFDLIFSNPPYYDSSLRNPDRREALARHCDTLSLSDIFSFAARYLKRDGRLSVILPSHIAAAARRSAASFGMDTFRVLHIRTTAAKAPKRTILEFRRDSPAGHIGEETLTLTENGSRTMEYKELTNEFYLY